MPALKFQLHTSLYIFVQEVTGSSIHHDNINIECCLEMSPQQEPKTGELYWQYWHPTTEILEGTAAVNLSGPYSSTVFLIALHRRLFTTICTTFIRQYCTTSLNIINRTYGYNATDLHSLTYTHKNPSWKSAEEGNRADCFVIDK